MFTMIILCLRKVAAIFFFFFATFQLPFPYSYIFIYVTTKQFKSLLPCELSPLKTQNLQLSYTYIHIIQEDKFLTNQFSCCRKPLVGEESKQKSKQKPFWSQPKRTTCHCIYICLYIRQKGNKNNHLKRKVSLP